LKSIEKSDYADPDQLYPTLVYEQALKRRNGRELFPHTLIYFL